jgi:hypothetical protein
MGLRMTRVSLRREAREVSEDKAERKPSLIGRLKMEPNLESAFVFPPTKARLPKINEREKKDKPLPSHKRLTVSVL